MLDNLISLMLILSPLVVGFFLPFPKTWLGLVEQILSKLVLVILFFIGVSLSHVQNIGSQLDFILFNVVVLAICCIGGGAIGLIWFDKKYPWHRTFTPQQRRTGGSLISSVIQLGMVILGFIVGRWISKMAIIQSIPIGIESVIKGLLMLLILLVGLQLSHSGMTLREVLFNKRGVQVSAIFCVGVAIGGIMFGLIMPEVSLMQGLALSSGYGWYSLSGIVMTDKYGAVWGSVALLNDLSREFLSFIMIPVLMRNFPHTAVSLGGVTSMDFTLPVIQSSGGNEVLPLAMSFGFIVNIISPVLMVIFSSFG